MQNNAKTVCCGVNLVFGYGKFGRWAVRFLQSSLGHGESILVIDKEPKSNVPDDVQFVCAEGVEWLASELVISSPIQRIIPALPIHFAAKWVERKLSQEGWIVKPYTLSERLLKKLPHLQQLSPDSAITSHAEFQCPINCSEPDDICSYTRQQRPVPLYHILGSLNSEDFNSLMLKSRQFAPGVGGYYPDDLWLLLSAVKGMPNRPILVSTACKCHGIVNGMYIEKRVSS